MVLHLAGWRGKAKLVNVVKIRENIFVCGMGVFYCTQQKYCVHKIRTAEENMIHIESFGSELDQTCCDHFHPAH